MKTNKFSACLALSCIAALLPASALCAEEIVLERGPHHKTVQYIHSITNQAEEVTLVTNRFTHLQNGMHRLANGIWVETEEGIQEHPAGAIAPNLAYQAIFAADIDRASSREGAAVS